MQFSEFGHQSIFINAYIRLEQIIVHVLFKKSPARTTILFFAAIDLSSFMLYHRDYFSQFQHLFLERCLAKL